MISVTDRAILRPLAAATAEAAEITASKHLREEWSALNDLRTGARPMVWINEVCWNEFKDHDELRLQCADGPAREIEWMLRSQLFQFRYFPGDMIVDPWFNSPLVLREIDFGLRIRDEVIEQGSGDISSHHYESLIRTADDAMKIVPPTVSVDPESDRLFETAEKAFGDLLPVRSAKIPTWWFAPWDWIAMRWNIEEAMMALVLEPELVHLVMQRFLEANLNMLEQFRRLNLLSFREGAYRVGSGGLGCTNELPAEHYDPDHVRTRDQWGCAVAQIFGEVSPEMHEEFALQYERRWLENFGLTYYGCCEPLHNKIGILRSIRNLRKISASPWCNLEKLISEVNRDYVISLKPSPAIFATEEFDLAAAEQTLRRQLEILRGANVEIILKDLSTIQGDFTRLSRWVEMATRVSEETGK